MFKVLLRVVTAWIFRLLLISLVLIFVADVVINTLSSTYLFTKIEEVPHNKTGLLLGTAKTLSSGQNNQYFYNRIDAAVTLFNSGKVDYLVVSGDNHISGYNEPQDMKDELVKRGIPEEKIYCDYAGFRTLDSVIRMWKIFGQTRFTIISQPFHIRRAIFIARAFGLEVVGFAAAEVNAYNGFKTRVREKFARVKVFVDLLFNTTPKYLGETIEIK